MKNLNLLFLAIALFTFSFANADPNPIKPNDELRFEIIDLIGTSLNAQMEDDQYSAKVLFTVNNNQELILLSVETENDQLEIYLKRRLNFKKVNHKPSKNGEIYLLPVKMIKDL